MKISSQASEPQRQITFSGSGFSLKTKAPQFGHFSKLMNKILSSKFILALTILGCLASPVFAEDFVCPDASYRRSVQQAIGCIAVPEATVPAQRDIDEKVPQKYRKVISNLLVEMSASEKTDVDTAEATAQAAAILSNARSGAKDSVDSLSSEGERLRAALLVTLDEINNLRQWIASFKTAVAGSSTLANLKTAVAALPDTPDRTASQVKTAIKGKIDNGLAD